MHVYLVTYDISDPKRLRRVYKVLRQWGDHLQFSVFRCEVGAADLVRLRCALDAEINHKEDQILFVSLGPVSGRGKQSIDSLGRPYTHPERHAIVVC